MARTARVVIAGLPHHVIQRGNRKQQVFFNDRDRLAYLKILKEESQKWGLKIWAYCLMINHVHLIVMPSDVGSLAKSIGETHKRYTRRINFREKWRGYLWQGRFNSFVLDEKYLYAAVRYVECNPIRAKLVNKAQDYRWSSAKSHILKKEDALLAPFHLMEEIKDWEEYLTLEESKDDLKLMRRHGKTGRPLGSKEFIELWSARLGKNLKPKKVGRPKKLVRVPN